MSTLRQLMCFGLIGVMSNAALYCLYLAATGAGIGPKTSMTGVFILGVLCTFVFNRRLTFRHRGAVTLSATRYVLTYAVAYLANVGGLILLVDVGGLPHQAVMLFLIAATAVAVFILQKVWVFGDEPASA